MHNIPVIDATVGDDSLVAPELLRLGPEAVPGYLAPRGLLSDSMLRQVAGALGRRLCHVTLEARGPGTGYLGPSALGAPEASSVLRPGRPDCRAIHPNNSCRTKQPKGLLPRSKTSGPPPLVSEETCTASAERCAGNVLPAKSEAAAAEAAHRLKLSIPEEVLVGCNKCRLNPRGCRL